jgi:hypothetical protein
MTAGLSSVVSATCGKLAIAMNLWQQQQQQQQQQRKQAVQQRGQLLLMPASYIKLEHCLVLQFTAMTHMETMEPVEGLE